MGRRAGSVNADYEASKEALARSLWPLLLARGGAGASLREMAEAAGVGVTTLRHYFGDRDGVLREVLASLRRAGERYLAEAARSPDGELRTSLRWLLDELVKGWLRGVGAVHGLGLTAGLGSETLGPTYVLEVLEPTLQATEARLRGHQERGQLGPCDLRHAALELLSPVVLVLLHQDGLFGSRCRPLDLGSFLDDHLDRFLRAYAPPARQPRAQPRGLSKPARSSGRAGRK